MVQRYIIDADNFSDADQNTLQKESKAYSLLECKKLKLNIPETMIITKESYEAYIQHGCIPAEVVKGVQEFIKRISVKGLLLVAVRCGDKNKQKKLPQTIINVGMTERHQSHFPREFMEENRRLYCKQVSRVTALLKERLEIEHYLEVDTLVKFPVPTQCLYVIQLVYEAFRQLALDDICFADYSIILQRMVFGNLDDKSCYGTAYTRHPYTGQEMDYGQYMMGMQGVEVNAMPDNMWKDMSELKNDIPHIYPELRETLTRIEQYYRDIRFVEFIVESGVLYFTQLSIRNRIYFPHIFETVKE